MFLNRLNVYKSHLLVKTIMRCSLIDGQSNLIESGYFNDASATITVHIIVGEVRHNLPQRNHVRVAGRILGEIILVNRNLLIR